MTTQQVKHLIETLLNETKFSLSNDLEIVNDNINFVRFLVRKYPNTTVEVDAQVEWDLCVKALTWNVSIQQPSSDY